MKNNMVFDESFFEDDGNWKNSEVMQEFVRNIEAKLVSAEPAEAPVEIDIGEYLEANADLEVDADLLIGNEITLEAVQDVIDSLTKLANKSYIECGNEQLAYEIESAIEKIKYMVLETKGE